ncbi:acetyltransferase [Halomonas daqingensis]|uniref:acetyltransferase n=1 Tax=Billgrantia desiderata TaxID=52021 RepID=UPI001F2B83A5|nr:acetyltransferase [Halomonas desiderata]MCE8027081.1 acetyltransferase [Halomonas desiderata]
MPVILLGGGGHAKVVLDLLHALEREILGVCDPVLATQGIRTWRGLPVLGDDGAVAQYAPDAVELVNGTGSLPGNHLRRRLHEQFAALEYRFTTLVHPSAIIGTGVEFGHGVQVMAGVIVQPDSRLGDDVIINTGSRLDHDTQIGNHVHIAPGAVLSGGVIIGSGCHIGVGATLIQGIRIGSEAVIGAGTTVISDVAGGYLQTGQPPRSPSRIKKE